MISQNIRYCMLPLKCSTSCLSKNLVQAFRTIRAIFAEGLKNFLRPAVPTGLQSLLYAQAETLNEVW